jgi:hypothetical protein
LQPNGSFGTGYCNKMTHYRCYCFELLIVVSIINKKKNVKSIPMWLT